MKQVFQPRAESAALTDVKSRCSALSTDDLQRLTGFIETILAVRGVSLPAAHQVLVVGDQSDAIRRSLNSISEPPPLPDIRMPTVQSGPNGDEKP